MTASIVGTNGVDIFIPDGFYTCSTDICGTIGVELVAAKVPGPGTFGLLGVG